MPINLIIKSNLINEPRATGIAWYSRGLIESLAGCEEVQVKCFSLTGWIDLKKTQQTPSHQHQHSLLKQGVRSSIKLLAKIDAAKQLMRFLLTRFMAHSFKKQCAKINNAIYLESNYILLPFNGPSICTVYDLSFITHPECHPNEMRRYLTANLGKSIKTATHIMTISEFSKQEIMKHYQVSADKISIVPPGVNRDYHPRTADQVNVTLKKYGLDYGKYVLCVGTIEPRKNLINLMRAFAKLPEELKQKYPLVLAGGKGWLYSDIEKEIHTLQAKKHLIYVGYVSQQDVYHLYSGAAACAYVSIYEGFGMPILEAMASGIPVVTSNCTSMPDVADDAALLADPFNVDDISQKLLLLLTDVSLRVELIQKGLARINHFQWSDSAQKLLELLKKLDVYTQSD